MFAYTYPPILTPTPSPIRLCEYKHNSPVVRDQGRNLK